MIACDGGGVGESGRQGSEAAAGEHGEDSGGGSMGRVRRGMDVTAGESASGGVIGWVPFGGGRAGE